ncbi:MAG: hypothetical protein HC910_21565 [Spirulinaceae cyanobacterium SM2_1_0]|nr:hypothetical protein [Spirulinaceae cyanobacterium SM2_1_0]
MHHRPRSPPYGKSVQTLHRSSVIAGSTNKREFLEDETGNRRFWVCTVSRRVPFKQVESERDQIWAAAVAAYKAGEEWWLTAIEERQNSQQNEDFENIDPWLTAIEQWIERKSLRETTPKELLEDCIEIPLDRQTRREQMRVTDCLKVLGWERTPHPQTRPSGRRSRVWKAPEGPGIPGGFQPGEKVRWKLSNGNGAVTVEVIGPGSCGDRALVLAWDGKKYDAPIAQLV